MDPADNNILSSVLITKKEDLKNIRKEASSKNLKIVFTYGTFDLIHSGHTSYLAMAKQHGDILIVGVSSDTSKRDQRGKGYPMVHQINRAEVLAYLGFVDGLIFVDDRNLINELKALKPDIFYTHSLDWKSHLRKADEEIFIKNIGGKIIKISPSQPFISSSDIVQMVADLKIKEIIEYFFGKIKIDLSKGDWKIRKFSGLKTSIREESIFFGDHIQKLGIFGHKFSRKILTTRSLNIVVQKHKDFKDKIVFTSGSCDLIHAGHLRFFSKAKENGNILILGLPSDEVIRKQKGRGRPIVNEKSRAELMSFFDCIDYVYIFNSESVIPVLEKIKPDVFFTVQEEWNDISKSGLNDIIKKWRGKIITSPPQASGLSSSRLIRKVAGIRVRQVFREVPKEAEKWNVLKD